MVIKHKKIHGESGDVIDMGSPCSPCRPRPRATYLPNARLYPGVQSAKKKPRESHTKLDHKRKIRPSRQLVPNPRLYRAQPRRLPAPTPPALPAVSWVARGPTACLDTASGAAMRLAERRTEQHSPRRVPANPIQQSIRPRRSLRRVQRQHCPTWPDTMHSHSTPSGYKQKMKR